MLTKPCRWMNQRHRIVHKANRVSSWQTLQSKVFGVPTLGSPKVDHGKAPCRCSARDRHIIMLCRFKRVSYTVEAVLLASSFDNGASSSSSSSSPEIVEQLQSVESELLSTREELSVFEKTYREVGHGTQHICNTSCCAELAPDSLEQASRISSENQHVLCTRCAICINVQCCERWRNSYADHDLGCIFCQSLKKTPLWVLRLRHAFATVRHRLCACC